MKLFLQKNAKFSSAGGSAPKPPCLQRLGALPLNPQPPAAGASPSDPHWPPAAGDFAPDPQNSPPLRISGYAPESQTSKNQGWQYGMVHWYGTVRLDFCLEVRYAFFVMVRVRYVGTLFELKIPDFSHIAPDF